MTAPKPPPAPDSGAVRDKPPGLGGSGRDTLAEKVSEAKTLLDEQHAEAVAGPAKRKRGRPKKVDPAVLAMDEKLCAYLVGVPFELSGSVGAAMLPAALRDDFRDLWQLGPKEQEIGGKALHVLALRYGASWAQYLPFVVLAAVMGGGYASRLALSMRIVRAARREARGARQGVSDAGRDNHGSVGSERAR